MEQFSVLKAAHSCGISEVPSTNGLFSRLLESTLDNLRDSLVLRDPVMFEVIALQFSLVDRAEPGLDILSIVG